MRAIRYSTYGDPEVLALDEVERPTPGTSQVLLAVAGSTFNPVDATIRSGALAEVFPLELPHVPGIDVAGTVAALGDGVSELAVGQPVIGFLPMTADGSAAEYVVVPAGVLAPAPRTIELADAAALPSIGLSAWQILFELAGLEPGQRLLVVGAGGAVGELAVQLAADAGAHVTASAGRRHHARLAGDGAERLVGPVGGEGDLGDAYDAVVNLAAIDEQAAAGLTGLVVDGGVVVSSATPVPDDPARGVRAAALFAHSGAATLTELAERVDAGRLHLHIAARRPLADLPAVHAEHAAGVLPGKTVVTVA